MNLREASNHPGGLMQAAGPATGWVRKGCRLQTISSSFFGKTSRIRATFHITKFIGSHTIQQQKIKLKGSHAPGIQVGKPSGVRSRKSASLIGAGCIPKNIAWATKYQTKESRQSLSAHASSKIGKTEEDPHHAAASHHCEVPFALADRLHLD